MFVFLEQFSLWSHLCSNTIHLHIALKPFPVLLSLNSQRSWVFAHQHSDRQQYGPTTETAATMRCQPPAFPVSIIMEFD